MATNYARGRAFEYRVRDRLKKDGAAYVVRAAQSKGIVDLLALWPWTAEVVADGLTMLDLTPPWLIQVKYSIKGKAGRLSARDEIELISLSEVTGGIPVLATQGPNGRGVVFTNLLTKEPLN